MSMSDVSDKVWVIQGVSAMKVWVIVRLKESVGANECRLQTVWVIQECG